MISFFICKTDVSLNLQRRCVGSTRYIGIDVIMVGDSRRVEEILGTITGTMAMVRHGHTYHRMSIWICVVGWTG